MTDIPHSSDVWVQVTAPGGVAFPALYRMRVESGWLYKEHGSDVVTFVPDPRAGCADSTKSDRFLRWPYMAFPFGDN